MQNKEINFSEYEWQLMLNSEFLLAKREVIRKTALLLDVFHKHLIEKLQPEHLPAELKQTSGGKISRGENYKGLPYVLLDFPAVFGKEGVFACRTMFWWGMNITFSIHCSGMYVEKFRPKFLASVKDFCGRGYFLSVSENEWEQEITNKNFIAIEEANISMIENEIQALPFIRISHAVPVNEILNLNDTGLAFYSFMLKKLSSDSLP